MMRFFSLLLLAATLCSTALAEDFYLVLRQADGTCQALPLTTLCITFEDGQLKATSGAESLALDLTTMQSMYFSNNTTSVNTIAAEHNAPTFVYDLQGRPTHLGDKASERGGAQPGIYIIKDGEGARKEIMR